MDNEEETIQEDISSARNLFSDGHVQDAKDVIEQAALKDPENPIPLHLLGEAALEMDMLELAGSLFKKTVDINTCYFSAHYNLGIINQILGDTDRAIESYHSAIQYNPEYTSAFFNLGNLYANRGQMDDAIDCLKKAAQTAPDFFEAFYTLANILCVSGNLEEALECYQKCIELNPKEKHLAELLHTARDKKKMLEGMKNKDFMNTNAVAIDSLYNVEFLQHHKKSLAATRGDNKIVLIVSFPKCGSTYLMNTLLNLSDHGAYRLCYRNEQNDHDLYLPYLSMWNQHGVISLVHMKATLPNVELIKLFDIRPIITVRNIFDTVASLLNNLNQGKLDSTKALGYSFLWQDQTIMDMSDERKIDCLIDFAVPWCINYYVSWIYFTRQGQFEAKWVHYDDIMDNWEATIRSTCDFVGMGHKCTDEALVPLKQSRNSPYNSTKQGADLNPLSMEQKKRIVNMISYYPDVDFAEFGFFNRAEDGSYSLNP